MFNTSFSCGIVCLTFPDMACGSDVPSAASQFAFAPELKQYFAFVEKENYKCTMAFAPTIVAFLSGCCAYWGVVVVNQN
jgi:hypothetical protein